MPNINCLQYAARGNNATAVPAGAFQTVGWNHYVAGHPGIVADWSSLANAVRDLINNQAQNANGLALMRILASNPALLWTARTVQGAAIPPVGKVIVMGYYLNDHGVHYFVRDGGVWSGVSSMADLIVNNVTVTGNSNFTQSVTGGTLREGRITGWFA